MMMLFLLALLAVQSSPSDLEAILKREILQPGVAVEELQAWLDPKIPSLPAAKTAEEWRGVAERLREDTLEKVVFRGEARRWRDAATKVEWMGDIPGGPGYSIRKVRYEALPGMWVPALLYVPDGLSTRVPVHLAVNGHDGKGKAADYKQIRCINLAKRGMLALNAEWFGMGQFRTPGFQHGLINAIDLCGTSGIST
ncbi:MAG TPA: hypothetical protein VEJ18_01445, partial [Planctomycetota bacterium]|nr:hypothetical protein [Planctomycetota bacterium]